MIPRLRAAWLSVGSWWSRRTLRTRLVALSIVPLVVALCVGTVAVALFFSAGRIRAVDRQTGTEVSTLAELARSGQLTSPLPIPAGAPLLAQVIGADGTVVAASASASLVLPLVTGDIASARARTYTDDDNPFGAAELRLRTQPVPVLGKSGLIVVAAPLADVQGALRSLRTVIIGVVPVLVLLVGLLEWAVIGLTLRPVERLRAAAADLAADARSPRGRDGPGMPPQGGSTAATVTTLLPVGSGDDEITRLSRTLNDLLRSLQRSLWQQRNFVSDAAHELRSPVTSLLVQLDVARAHPSTLTTSQLAAELSGEIERLARLVDDLLLLGRLETAGPGRLTPVDLAEVAGLAAAPVVVLGDRDSLQRLVRNLVDNARDHARTVRLSVHADDGVAVLDVDDDGPGIAVEDRQRVFERWTRLDTARARATGGSGLGLALVREIATAHAGTVSISESDLGGARVRVTLPLAASPGSAGPTEE